MKQPFMKTLSTIKVWQREKEALCRENQALRHQLKQLERQNQLEKTESISFYQLGQLVAAIVHDLQGGLGIIQNTAGFMLDDLDELDLLVADVHKIIQSTQFCELILRNLMAVGKRNTFTPTEVNIEKTVSTTFFILKRKLIDVNLVLEVDPDLPTIMSDEGNIKQIFMNLIKNAGEAMPDGGTITIRTRREAEMLCIDVSDTGNGIPADVLDRIFDLHFTSKEKGIGLGLYIVRAIVEAQGGDIAVESEVNRGTTFIIHLPIAQEVA